MNAEDLLAEVGRDEVRVVAEAALGRTVIGVGEWNHAPLGASLGPATGGLFRVWGTANVGGGDGAGAGAGAEWSAVLKVLRPPVGTRHDVGARQAEHWAYWRREALAYQSGLLANLPGGLTAPRCLAVEERAPDVVWLWLEEVEDRFPGEWTAAQHERAARLLGAFNGAYQVDRALPEEPWLGRRYLRQRIERTDATGGLPLFGDRGAWEREPLSRAFDRDTGERMAAVWAQRYALLNALEGLPQVLRHGDAHRSNLFVRTGDEDRLCAIDWGTLGVGAVGAEIVYLATSRYAMQALADTGGSEAIERVYEAYVEGMMESGWRGDIGLARLGFSATVALTWASLLHWWLVPMLDPERRAARERGMETSAEDLLRRLAALARWLPSVASEAEALARGR